MKITGIEVHVLLAPNMDKALTASAQDNLIVIIHTDEGVSGIGESDVNPWMAKACINAPGTHTMGLSIRDMLYKGTAMSGRRGVITHAMGAIDMVLWDLKGKIEGKPVFELLGGAKQKEVTPYASLLPKGRSCEAYRDALVEAAVCAKAMGFKAAKAEVIMNGPYAHDGMRESHDRHTDVVAAVRRAIGPDMTLMVDAGYLWPDAKSCLEIVRDRKEFDIFFLETPVWSDDVDELRKVRDGAPLRIAAGEWLATRYEFSELMDVGGGVPMPIRPGLGIELDYKTLKRFTVA